ncbi:Gtr1/RagA G protein Gtr2 [Coccidioides immitis H538.4]|uniref:GTP-binding protein n=1 Tax=Coccidioides immitis H538.4 TaxID=396776 RepID=A0A0J8RAS6_COCIT|nr:Gtr1/RagA G protein Gtr2 [Coccidioides immitis H538.4]
MEDTLALASSLPHYHSFRNKLDLQLLDEWEEDFRRKAFWKLCHERRRPSSNNHPSTSVSFVIPGAAQLKRRQSSRAPGTSAFVTSGSGRKAEILRSTITATNWLVMEPKNRDMEHAPNGSPSCSVIRIYPFWANTRCVIMPPPTPRLTPRRHRSALKPGQERLVFSDSSILHGQPAIMKTRAQLSLEKNLQAMQAAQSSSQQPVARAEQAPRKKPRDEKPRLLLMGLRRSGKSSISSVVFHKMPPNETLFLESTTRIQKDSIHSFMDFQIWDFPGQLEYLEPSFDLEELFSTLGALVWVIDAQDDYTDAVARLNRTILMIQQYYPHINIEVFIHKVDGLSEEFRSDIFQGIVQHITDET